MSNMKKESNVHRLSSETGIISECIKSYTEEKTWNVGDLIPYDDGHTDYWTTQHLYITTDEEIKEGDWYLATIFGCGTEETKPLQWSVGTKPCGEQPMGNKIIATTDPKLIAEGVKEIPQSFIEKYCKAGGIDKVLVEYEFLDKTRPHPFQTGATITDTFYRLKTDSNNCIIIHPVEEKMYSGKEMIDFAKYAIKNGFGLNHIENLFDKWIKENL